MNRSFKQSLNESIQQKLYDDARRDYINAMNKLYEDYLISLINEQEVAPPTVKPPMVPGAPIPVIPGQINPAGLPYDADHNPWGYPVPKPGFGGGNQVRPARPFTPSQFPIPDDWGPGATPWWYHPWGFPMWPFHQAPANV